MRKFAPRCNQKIRRFEIIKTIIDLHSGRHCLSGLRSFRNPGASCWTEHRGTQGGVEGRYRQKGIYPFMCYPHCFCARPLSSRLKAHPFGCTAFESTNFELLFVDFHSEVPRVIAFTSDHLGVGPGLLRPRTLLGSLCLLAKHDGHFGAPHPSARGAYGYAPSEREGAHRGW